jgi:hypothetical protein
MDLLASGSKGLPAANGQLRDAVQAAGGAIAEFPCPPGSAWRAGSAGAQTSWG